MSLRRHYIDISTQTDPCAFEDITRNYKTDHESPSDGITKYFCLTVIVSFLSRRESGLSKKYLEWVVSDVQRWQAQIQSILQYVSKKAKLEAEEMKHVLKLRIMNLQRQNRELLRKEVFLIFLFDVYRCNGFNRKRKSKS